MSCKQDARKVVHDEEAMANGDARVCLRQGPYKAVGAALEVIPRTLAQNCGANVIRTLTKLRAKHVEKANSTFGIDGNKGEPSYVAIHFCLSLCCTH